MNDRIVLVIAVLGGWSLLSLVWLTLLTWKMRRVSKRYARLVGGDHPKNLEEVLLTAQEELRECRRGLARAQQQWTEVENRLKTMKGRVGLVRYSAFGERGHDLSFSLAILDEGRNGAVLSGIHNREQMYVYAKPVENGESRYPLTPEEREAIHRASQFPDRHPADAG
ncbi:MAG: hypothetical protein BLM47_07730 [Candidatus Reconcilbacillus cellulovorans]|uniref:DUF4446 domain-containing protein n=1 Tax=Candidatus Reconcilbacillus cellulovorans TaxID=1906605 RepID=A0A2A6E0R4_9BACL|nr:MAG: hypothetical protein BLM47_07730 [Candidatus Reconcilbacillus cellulovorans]